MPRKYPVQIVAMTKQPMGAYVRDRAAELEESQAEVVRQMLETAKVVQDVADRSGHPVSAILDSVRGLAPRAE